MTAHPLPGALPAGERVLWQGSPNWRALARDAMHLRVIGLYCGALVAWVGLSAALHGAGAADIAADTGRAALAASVPLVLGLVYAWFSARAATYTITNRRVLIRMGAALPMTMNLPFARVASAGLRAGSLGTGEIKLQLIRGGERPSSLILWPHARLGRGQPVLRALPDAERAGQVLARALAASVDAPAPLAPAAGVMESGREHHGHTVAA